MGEVKVPADKYWGAQTQRSLENFQIGPIASMPIELIRAYAYLKKAAAFTNHQLGVLNADKKEIIQEYVMKSAGANSMNIFLWLFGKPDPAHKPT